MGFGSVPRPKAGDPQTAAPVGTSARRRTWVLRLFFGLFIAVLVFFAVQWAGGVAVRHLVNERLAAMDGYEGRVGRVRLLLLRGGATIEDFVLRERDKPGEAPLVRVRRATLTAALRPLLRGKLGGDGVVEDAEIVFAKHHAFEGPRDAAAKAKAEAQEKEEQVKQWQEVLTRALPIELTRFELRRGRCRFRR